MDKKTVTNKDVELAYFGGTDTGSQKIAADNRGIIRGVTKCFVKILSAEEMESCGLIGLWKCLKAHDDNHPSKQKFTSSLHRFVLWECRKAAHEKKPKKNRKHEDKYYYAGLKRFFDIPTTDLMDSESGELIGHIKECLNELKPRTRSMINDYYFHGMTMDQIGNKNGYTREAARENVGRAVNSLFQNCRAKLKMPIPAYSFAGE